MMTVIHEVSTQLCVSIDQGEEEGSVLFEVESLPGEDADEIVEEVGDHHGDPVLGVGLVLADL